MPTFEEALALCGELGLGINVEIKPCRGREVETARVAVATLLDALAGRRARAADLELRAGLPGVARELAPALPRG